MLVLALSFTAPALALPPVTVPLPDTAVEERVCTPGTGPGTGLPCVELYAYRVDLTDMWARITLTGLEQTFGIGTVDLDATFLTIVNEPVDPFAALVTVSIAGLPGAEQVCDGWIEEFPSTAHSHSRIIVNPFTGAVRVDMDPIEAEIGMQGDDVVLVGPDCDVAAIDAALAAIPGVDVTVGDLVVAVVVPELEQQIADLTPAVEARINATL